MQGGAASGLSLTGYTLVSLLENSDNPHVSESCDFLPQHATRSDTAHVICCAIVFRSVFRNSQNHYQTVSVTCQIALNRYI